MDLEELLNYPGLDAVVIESSEQKLFRYAMMEGFAEIVRGEKQNPYSMDYELALYRILMKACGAE